MEILRVGVIGATKGFGGGRCRSLVAHGRAKVVAVCARSRGEVAELAHEIGAKAYTAWQGLVADADVQAVTIATPNALHFEMAKAALEAGKHTLVEYPICQSLAEYDELMRLAGAKGVVLHHALTTRGEPIHRKVKELAPRLGRIFHAHYRYFGGSKWYVDPTLRGDPFVTLHIHFLDQFEDIMGPTVRLNATWKVLQEGERVIHSGTVLQEFADGANAFQEFGMGFPAQPSYQGWYIGENGWLMFEGWKTLRLVLADGTDETLTPEEGKVVAFDTDNFLARALDGAASWIPEEQTRRALRLSLCASESARTGRKLSVA